MNFIFLSILDHNRRVRAEGKYDRQAVTHGLNFKIGFDNTTNLALIYKHGGAIKYNDTVFDTFQSLVEYVNNQEQIK